jgi:hypothetical protein
MENQGSLSLMSMKDCSPMVAFAVYVIVSGITLYMTRNNLKKNGNNKFDDLYNLYTWHELKYIIVMGVVLYGLCQYKQENLAWISLTLPILYLILKNMYVFIHIFTSQQQAGSQVKTPEPIVKKDIRRKLHQELLKQQEELQKQQIDQQNLQQQKFQQQVQNHYQPPVNKDIGGLTPPLNSYDPSGGTMAMF